MNSSSTSALFLASALVFCASCTHAEPASRPASSGGGNGIEGPAQAPVPTFGQDQLGAYLANAVRAVRWHARFHETAPPRPGIVDILGPEQVRALLARLDLSQKASGPVSKCPGMQWYQFFDASGTNLGRITFDGCAPRFDSPDGKVMGSIRADL